MTTIYVPETIEELLAYAANCRGTVEFVAGATDWTISHIKKIDNEAFVIDLSSVTELQGVRQTSGFLTVGPMETMTALSENMLLLEQATCLAEAAGRLGSWQIRNRATVGGNIANASPAADTPVALAALGADVILRSPDGTRTLSVCEMASAPGKSVLKNGEMIAEVRIPTAPRRFSSFGKIGSRSEVSIARLNMAVCVEFDETGARNRASVFLGTLGAHPLRAREAEEILIEKGCTGIEIFCDALSAAVEIAIPTRVSMPYKRRAVRALGIDLSDDLREKAKRGGFSL